MISFKFIQAENKNFTPANKIIEYAKKNGLNWSRAALGTLFLEVSGNDYTYNHYEIHSNGDGTETVEIFLALA